MNISIRIIFVTVPQQDAEHFARTLLEERLVACINMLPEVTSLYWWKGKIDSSSEVLLILKTPSANIRKLLKRVKELHTYDVPEFLALPVMESNPHYVRWIRAETKFKKRKSSK